MTRSNATRGRAVCRATYTLVLLLGGWLIVNTAIAAGVYRWVDEKGKVHYGDRPPSSITSHSLKVKPSTSPSQAPASEAERAARQRQLLYTFEAERIERENKRAEERQALAKKRELERKCALAREDLKQLRSASGVYDYDHNGQRRYMSDEQRAAYIKKYEAGVKKHCK